MAPVTLVSVASSTFSPRRCSARGQRFFTPDLLRGAFAGSGHCRRDALSTCCRMASSIGACRSAVELRDVFRARTVRPPRQMQQSRRRTLSGACTRRQRHAGEITAVEHNTVCSSSSAPSPEAADRLRALGYVSSSATATTQNPGAANPASQIAAWSEFERDLALVNANRAAEALGPLRALVMQHPDAPSVQLDICSRAQGRGTRGRGCRRVPTRRRTMAPGPWRFPRSGGRRARGWRHS